MKFGIFSDVSARNVANDGSGRAGFASAQNLDTFVDYVVEAEKLGFHGVFLVEHHFTGNGQISSSLSVLAYLAGRTSTIRLGTGVVVLPWHNPVLLAEQVATIDQLSRGRFDLGVGKGYRPHEFAGFCMSNEEAAARYEETLAFLRRAWTTEGRFRHEGEFWTFDNITIDPPVVQRPHPPIWIGASSEASCVRAGQEGFRLLLDQIATADMIGEKVAAYSRACTETGRPVEPQSIGVTRALHLVKNDDEWREAHATRARLLEALGKQVGRSKFSSFNREDLPTFVDSSLTIDEASLIGYPHEVVERLKILESYGVDYVLLADFAGSQESLRIFAQEVMPHFA